MKKLLLLFLLAIPYSLFPKHTFALPVFSDQPFEIKDYFQPAIGGFTTFGDLASVILTILTSLAGVIAVFFIILAGIKFVTASGDEKKLQSASSMITYAIIGLAVTALAFVILQIVQFLLGADIGTV